MAQDNRKDTEEEMQRREALASQLDDFAKDPQYIQHFDLQRKAHKFAMQIHATPWDKKLARQFQFDDKTGSYPLIDMLHQTLGKRALAADKDPTSVQAIPPPPGSGLSNTEKGGWGGSGGLDGSAATASSETETATTPVADPHRPQGTAPPRVILITADELGRILFKRWRIVAITVAVAVGIAVTLAALQPKVYRASSVAAVVAAADNVSPDEVYRGVEVLEQRTIVSTIAALASLPAIEREAYSSNAGASHYAINAAVLPNTSLLRVDVDGPDPAVAAAIANRVPAILAEQARVMYGLYSVKTMSAASLPTAATSPRLALAIVVGAIVGLILGAGIAAGLENLKRKQRADGPPRGGSGGTPSRSRAYKFLSIATPLLVIIIYANLSDLLMRRFSTTSLLQPLLVLLAAAVWWLRREVKPSEVILQPLTLLLAAYCFFLFASSIWAADAAVSGERFVESLKGLVIFIVVGSLVVTWRLLRGALVALTITAAMLATLTIGQVISGTKYEFGGLASLKAGNVYGDVSELRASGPLDDPNFYAQLLLLALPLAAFAGYTEKRPVLRAIYMAAAVIIAAGVLLTYSRGAMVALAAVIVAPLFLTRVRMVRVVLIALVMVSALSLLPSAVMRRFSTAQALLPGQERVVREDASIDERRLFLASAWRMFDDHPLLGVGAGNFSTLFHRYAGIVGSPARLYYDPGDTAYPHMLYLQIAAETGLIGLSLFLAAAGTAFRALHRAHRMLRDLDPQRAAMTTALAIALIAYLVTALFLHGSYQRDFWLVLAFVAAVTRLAAQSAGSRFLTGEAQG